MKRILSFLRFPGARHAEWRDEIESHLALREEWHRDRGLSPEDARRAARRQFGSPLTAVENVRAVHILPWIESVFQDLRYAARTWRKWPAFSVVAILTMAIGIGASTAVFSVVDPLLFRPLPYPHDDRLVSMGFFGPVSPNEFNVVSSYLDWRAQKSPFASMTSMRRPAPCDLMDGDSPRRLTCHSVEANFLRFFGAAPVLGRDFTPDDDRPGAPTVALLSYALWQRAFGGDPAVLGRTLTLDEAPVRVVGVLPRTFEMPQPGEADVLLPERLDAGRPRVQNAGSLVLTFARLRDGVSLAQARHQMQPLFVQALQDVPAQLRSEVSLALRSLRELRIHNVKQASWILFGAVLALLLAACANVANLMLARAAARRRELAMRAAIGAGRGRLVRQTFTESLLLGLAGGAAGCITAWALVSILVRLAPEGMAQVHQARLDWRVLLFALAASIASAVLFGLAPALERPHTGALVSRSGPTPAGLRFRSALIATQIAISMVLLTGASLFSRSLWRMEAGRLGFESRGLVTASFTLRQQRYRPAESQLAFFGELEDRMRRLPGVESFALSDSVPPRGAMERPYSNLVVAGRPPVAANGGMVLFRWVTPGYFRTMRIPFRAGRDFEEADRIAGESPVVLSEGLARRLFGNENPIGQQISLDADGRRSPVVGVVEDARNNGLGAPPGSEYYRLRMKNAAQSGRSAVALFRTPLDTAALAGSLRREVAAIDPTLPLTIETMDERVGRFLDLPRFLAALVALFGGLSLALGAVGIYGVLGFLVTQRTREIGIRMALGARPLEVALLMEGHAAIWTAIGVAAGVAGSLALTRTIRGLLFEVAPGDPLSLAAAGAVLTAVAGLAAWIPSRRAARVDPVIALRQD